jgi:hypothetical protein
MEQMDTIIAVFPDHSAAEGAVKGLAQAGFDVKSLSVVGKGYHTAAGKAAEVPGNPVHAAAG